MQIFSEDNEKELLQRIAAGDRKAFTRLFDQYQRKVYSHALTFIKSPQEAEEYVTDIFMKVWQNRDRLPGIDNFKNYLFILGKNYLLSAIRKRTLITTAVAEDQYPENILLPDQQYDLKQMNEIIQKGIDALSPQQKKVFVLSRTGGLSYEEIAAQLAISKRTVKFHMILALNFLREYIRYHSIHPFLLAGIISLLKK